MYSLDCPNFNMYFNAPHQLIEYIIENGIDPNYEITFNDDGIGELAIDWLPM